MDTNEHKNYYFFLSVYPLPATALAQARRVG